MSSALKKKYFTTELHKYSSIVEENDTAKLNLIKKTFEKPFNKSQFNIFVKNLVNTFDEANNTIPTKIFQNSIKTLECIGKYKTSDEKIDILIANLKNESSLERARVNQKNCISWYLKNINKDGALVAFVPPNKEDWRFSFVRIDYRFDEEGKVKEESTPARRCSFLVGKNEASHTAQSSLLPLLRNDERNPSLEDLESAFSVEKVTKEFYEKYRELFHSLKESLDEIIKKDKKIKMDFESKKINSADFSKKLLGQIVFIYFLQKKGWFGVKKGEKWGTGSKKFIRKLFTEKKDKNFFNDILEPLFYNALNKKYKGDYNKQLQCRIPFLNGGLFKPIGGYDWENTNIPLPNSLFSNKDSTKEGNGILDVFERYNFTVNENEPLEKEVAIDPEMLGKVFENLLEIKDRKSKGTYYTPREIVHYMCQESLINYLMEELKEKINKEDIETLVKHGESAIENERLTISQNKETKKSFKLSEKIRSQAYLIDKKLRDIRVCDPAVGSSAFPVGMMNKIIRVRNALTPFIENKKERTSYHFKRHAIQHCLYGVDIDSGAIEIAKLRLWLSLILDEDEKEGKETIQPLPNLDCKMVCGNSLIENIYHKAEESPIRTKTIYKLKDKKNLLVNAYPKERDILLQEINQLKKQLWEDDINREIKVIQEKMSQIGLFSNKTINNLYKYKSKVEEIKKNQLINMFDWYIDFCEVFNEKKGFDVVIANPPYVKEYVNRSAFDGLKESEYYQGKMDLWYFFACKSIDISKPNSGVVSFIAQNNWVTSFGASKMRNKVIKDSQILNLIDFGDFKIFDAGIQTMVMLFKRNSLLEKYTFDYRKLHGKNLEFEDIVSVLKKEENTKAEYINPELERKKFKNKTLAFSSSEIETIIGKLLSQSNFQLEDKEVAQGVVFPQDFVNGKSQTILGNQYKINDGVFVLSNKEKKQLSLTEKELKLIKPYYTTSELFRYHGNPKNKKWIIYTDSSFKDKSKIKDYPNIKKHLEQFKEIITSDNKPYGLHRARKENFFKAEKIISTRKCKAPTFTYVDFDSYVSATFYVIKTNRINQKYLTGILNSKLIAFWLKHKGKMQGSNYQIDKEPILSIPLIKVEQEKQKPFVELVDKILAITGKSDYLKNSIKQKQVFEYEKQIDQLVYKLYGLTSEKINIIETNCVPK